MRIQALLLIVAITVVFALAIHWLWASGKKKRSTPQSESSKKARESDTRVLTPMEQKVKKRAEQLANKGKLIQATQLLEQVGLHRDAITWLEEARMFDEAVAILLRLQRPGRAGVLYARNGLWSKAAPFFLQAGQTQDAAKAYREAAQFKEAAELFLKDQNFQEGADCYDKAGLHLESARAWYKASKYSMALRSWDKFGQQASERELAAVAKIEVDFVSQSIKSDAPEKGLIRIIAKSSAVGKHLVTFIKAGNELIVRSILGLSQPEVFLDLVAEASLDGADGKILAKVLRELKQDRYGAQVLERYSFFKEAAEAYEACGEKERAQYCLSRMSGDHGKPPPTPVVSGSPPAGGSSPPKTPPRPVAEKSPASSQFFIEATKENFELPNTWLLEGSTEEQRRILAKAMKPRFIRKGQNISIGAEDVKLVVILSGTLQGTDENLASGGWPGAKNTLLDQGITVWTAQEDTSVAFLTGAELEVLLSRYGQLTRLIYKNLTLRLLPQNPPSLKLLAIS